MIPTETNWFHFVIPAEKEEIDFTSWFPPRKAIPGLTPPPLIQAPITDYVVSGSDCTVATSHVTVQSASPGRVKKCNPKVTPKWPQSDPEMIPKWPQSDIKVIPKWHQSDPKVSHFWRMKVTLEPLWGHFDVTFIMWSRLRDHLGITFRIWWWLCGNFGITL